MHRNRRMRLLVTQTGIPSREFFDDDSLSVFLNITTQDCCTHIFYGFFIRSVSYILIDQLVFDYASGIWILQDNTTTRGNMRIDRSTMINRHKSNSMNKT